MHNCRLKKLEALIWLYQCNLWKLLLKKGHETKMSMQRIWKFSLQIDSAWIAEKLHLFFWDNNLCLQLFKLKRVKHFGGHLLTILVSFQEHLCACDDIVDWCRPASVAHLVSELNYLCPLTTQRDIYISYLCLAILIASSCFLYLHAEW